MFGDNRQFHLVNEASTKDAAIVARILTDGDVPNALMGVVAASYYGGGLCPLDIELVIGDTDQERAFDILPSHGVRPSVPEGTDSERPAILQRWRELAPSYQFRDRRRVRLWVPITSFL